MSVQTHIWGVIEGIWLLSIAVDIAVKTTNIYGECIK